MFLSPAAPPSLPAHSVKTHIRHEADGVSGASILHPASLAVCEMRILGSGEIGIRIFTLLVRIGLSAHAHTHGVKPLILVHRLFGGQHGSKAIRQLDQSVGSLLQSNLQSGFLQCQCRVSLAAGGLAGGGMKYAYHPFVCSEALTLIYFSFINWRFSAYVHTYIHGVQAACFPTNNQARTAQSWRSVANEPINQAWKRNEV